MLHESAGGEAARTRPMKRTQDSAEQIVKALHDAATAPGGGKTGRGNGVSPFFCHFALMCPTKSSDSGRSLVNSQNRLTPWAKAAQFTPGVLPVTSTNCHRVAPATPLPDPDSPTPSPDADLPSIARG
jgi:hypothetical protein